MMNMMNIVKQAQQFQKKMKDLQDELANTDVEVAAANGAIKVVYTGQARFKSLKLAKNAINPDAPETVSDDTVEMLEDLINAALKEVDAKASKVMEEKTTFAAKATGDGVRPLKERRAKRRSSFFPDERCLP